MEARIGLEDGTVLDGKLFGSKTSTTGELVFATPYTGYEEALTDPSYAGQFLMFTYPLIGNYGVRQQNLQSDGITCEAAVVREVCKNPSHHSSSKTLDGFLEAQGVPGIEAVDTRKLTVKLREQGVLNAAIVPGSDGEEAVEMARNASDISEKNLVDKVSVSKPRPISGKGPRVVVIDTGVKHNILRSLERRGYDIVVVPGTASPSLVRRYRPDAILFGNGPGDPRNAEQAQRMVKEFAGEIPIFGICLGNQLISLAMGGDTYKLKFGHRGGNQPVRNLETGEVNITSQNHGFAVRPQSLDNTDLEVWEVNPNDDTVEAVKSDYLDIYAVQYHPEAYPGPRDTESRFFDMISEVVSGA